MKHYGETSVRRKFRTAKFPYGEISVRRKFLRRKIRTAKNPYGENSVQRNFRTAKNPCGEKSYGEKSYGENSYGEHSYGENSLRRSTTLVSSNSLSIKVTTLRPRFSQLVSQFSFTVIDFSRRILTSYNFHADPVQ